ncbi:hypothetical protein FOA52_005330 [Chlamydomonas sp. UWO 241]|nr:hypothetical protein FOA52_005330 [Chlamydomonas sp. UWO 241]
MELFPPPPSGTAPQLQGATLVVVAVAQGNVGELSMDVLITNTGATLAGVLEDPNVLPVAGNDPHDMRAPGTLSTALELFELPASPSRRAVGNVDGPVFLLQQRAPVVLGRQAEFAENVVEWAQSQGIVQLLVLSGLDSTLRRDRQIMGDPMRYLAADAPGLAAACESAGVTQLEEEYLSEERVAHGALPPWPLLAGAARRGCAAALLGCFAAEGDNVPHALRVAGVALQLLGRSGGGSGEASTPGGSDLRLPCSFAALYGRASGMDELA